MPVPPPLRFRTLPFLLVVVGVISLLLVGVGYAYGSLQGFSWVQFMLVGLVLMLATTALVFAWVRNQFIEPLELMHRALRALARGRPTTIELDEARPYDILKLMRVVNQLSAGLYRLAGFARRVGEGQLDAPLQPLSDTDELGNALLVMRENLKQSAARDADRSWLLGGLARMSVQLNAAAEYESALGAALHELIAHLGAVQGAVYAVELEGMRRLATAGLASGADASRLPDGPPAELVAQVLQSDQAISLGQLPPDYLSVRTGLGQAALTHVALAQMGQEAHARGLIEIASFRAFTALELDFIRQVAALMGNVLSVGRANARTRELLERSESLNASLETQREELHRNLERLVAAQQDMKFAQAKLQQAAELNQKLYDEAQDGKGISDGRVLSDCNSALQQLLGVSSKEDVVGKTLLDFSPPDQPDLRPSATVLAEHVTRAFEQGRHDFDWQFVRPNGGNWYAEVNLLVLSGDRQTAVYSVRDITARKRTELDMRQMNAMLLERENELWSNIVALTEAQKAKTKVESELSETEQRLQQISNNAPVIIFRLVTDSDSKESKFLFVSAAAKRLSGYGVEQWLQFSFEQFLELLHPADRDPLRERSAQAIQNMRPFEAEGRLRTAEGNYRWVSVQSNPTAVTKSRVVSDGVISDITDIKELIFQIEEKNSELRSQEEELRQNAEELLSVNEEIERRNVELQQSQQELRMAVEQLRQSEAVLERKVAERTDELSRAKDEADRANQVKSLFLANMSHELRTPLNGILGYAQILHDAPEMPEGLRDKISIVKRSGEHLLSLINEVLDLSKIEAGKMELVPRRFALASFLEDLRGMFSLRATSKRLELVFQVSPDLPRTVIADEVKLRQCLVNLLSNAIKFTQEGRVSLEVYLQRDGRVRFAVIDTGRGIPAERIPDIVRPFKQISADLTTEGGTGLGLAITKSYVEMMGGRLSITSEVSKGSTFAFAIHLEEVDPASALAPLTATDTAADQRVVGYTAPHPMRILVVDDNEINREVALELLRTVGFEVTAAVDGEQAIEQYLSWRPHMILMDVRMPGISGLEATQRIRQLEGGQEVKICAVTASVFEGERKSIYKFGCDDYLPKPYKLSEMLGMIARHLPISYKTEAAPSSNIDAEALMQTTLDYAYLAKHLPRGLINHLAEHLEVGDYAEATRRIELLKRDDERVQAFKRLALYLLHEMRIDQVEGLVAGLKAALKSGMRA